MFDNTRHLLQLTESSSWGRLVLGRSTRSDGGIARAWLVLTFAEEVAMGVAVAVTLMSTCARPARAFSLSEFVGPSVMAMPPLF